MADTETTSSNPLDVNSPEFLAAQSEITKRIVAGDPDSFQAFEQAPDQSAETIPEEDAPSTPGL